MAAEEWQHEEWNALMVAFAGAAALADCELSEEPAIRTGAVNTLSFEWAGLTPLALELGKPPKQISIEFELHRPMFVTLWRQDGTGLRLSSEMHDVAERREVGLLRFEYASLPKDSETVVDIPSAFNGPITVFKLVIHESGTSVESGVVLKASDGSEIVVVANVYPYFLALEGVLPAPYAFEPEYPLDGYSRIRFTT